MDGNRSETSSEGFQGKGYAKVDSAIGKRMVWSVDVGAKGMYVLNMRFANGGSSALPGELFVNSGTGGSYHVEFPASGQWSNWQNIQVNVALSPGQNTLALVATTKNGLAAIDNISVSGSGTLQAGDCAGLQSSSHIFSVQTKLFNNANGDTLGLQYPDHVFNTTAYYAEAGLSQYNHGAVLIPFKGKLYLQWQSSIKDEDAKDTVVRFSRSSDGERWEDAQVLVPARAKETVTSGGWWTDGNTLVAYINVWPHDLSPRGGYSHYITSTDGVNWSTPERLQKAGGGFVNGIIEQDIKALPNGRLLTAEHEQPGLIVKPYYTDDPLGLSGWQAGKMTNLSNDGKISRELEPSWFVKADGSVTMVFRDQGGSYKILAATSQDNGVTWSKPETTDMPDSRAKQSAGNFTDGTAFLVNNPTGKSVRLPLVVSLSHFGNHFDTAYVLRGGEILPPMRHDGLYKREGYSYPKSIIWNGYLWVSYGINKEDVGVTRVPLSSLPVLP